MHEELPRMVRIAAETGRRPNQLLSLRFLCLDTESAGGPYLIYTESKVTGGQDRRLPCSVLWSIRYANSRPKHDGVIPPPLRRGCGFSLGPR
jgi:integrase